MPKIYISLPLSFSVFLSSSLFSTISNLKLFQKFYHNITNDFLYRKFTPSLLRQPNKSLMHFLLPKTDINIVTDVGSFPN